jgi:glycosyltransferase involved in cell wall biosynthesis
MPDNAPLLTIAIPTYNRAHYLEGLLAVLHEQLQSETRVELLVSDNASTDNTAATVAKYQSRGVAIRSIRNESNLGADRNILQCYLEASGKYVWVFSDDDLILPGTVKRVLDILSSGRYDMVNLTARFSEGDDNRRQSPHAPLPDREFTRPEDLARSIYVYFTFISSVILNKQRISSLPHRPFDSLLDTNLVQLGPVYSALNHHRRSLVIRDPLIAARGNSNVGYGLFRVFGTSFEKITREWIDKASVQHAIIDLTIRKFLPYWMMMSRESKASIVAENPHRILRNCYGNNMRYWVFGYPIYVLPLPLAKLWLLGVRIANKAGSILGGLLLKS